MSGAAGFLFVILNLAFIFQSNDCVLEQAVENHLNQPGKYYALSEIFGDTIRFNNICEKDKISTCGFQDVSQGNTNSHYSDYERIFFKDGNEINVKFHFLDTEKRLYQSVWKKYSLNSTLHCTENMFFTIKILYNGEEYVNTKLLNRIPLKYDLYSDIEMSGIDYDTTHVTNCQFAFGTLMNLQVNLSGYIYNANGNRSIALDGVRLFFQVAPFDTVKFERPIGAITYKPKLDRKDPIEDFLVACQQNEDIFEGEMYGLPCIRWKGKPYIIHNEYLMIFRLPEYQFKEALSLEGSLFFNPNGHELPSDEWIQIPFYYKDKWPYFATRALEYVKN